MVEDQPKWVRPPKVRGGRKVDEEASRRRRIADHLAGELQREGSVGDEELLLVLRLEAVRFGTRALGPKTERERRACYLFVLQRASVGQRSFSACLFFNVLAWGKDPSGRPTSRDTGGTRDAGDFPLNAP